jgi:hypothetical protein
MSIEDTIARLRVLEREQRDSHLLEDALTEAVDDICRYAGGINDYPSNRKVQEILKQRGLVVVLRSSLEKD